jgi:hypothetical protein
MSLSKKKKLIDLIILYSQIFFSFQPSQPSLSNISLGVIKVWGKALHPFHLVLSKHTPNKKTSWANLFQLN